MEPHVNPAVTAALIAAASTGWVAVLGFAGALWKTRWSVSAERETLWDQRIWEKRSALYDDLFTLLPILMRAWSRESAGESGSARNATARLSPELLARWDPTGLDARIREYASHNAWHAFTLLHVVRGRTASQREETLTQAAINGDAKAQAEVAVATQVPVDTWKTDIYAAGRILENIMRDELQHGPLPRRGWIARRLRPERCEWPCPTSADPFPPLHIQLGRGRR